jgi:hypothetical protein
MTKSEKPSATADTGFFDQLDKSIAAYKETAVDPSVKRFIHVDADWVYTSDGHIAIQPVHDWQVLWNRPPFVIGGVHDGYEWPMALADRHPYHPSLLTERRVTSRVGVDDEGLDKELRDRRMQAIESSPKSKAIFKALEAAYKGGKIKPVPAAWDEELPDDLLHLHFRRDDIPRVVSDLGADGEVIAMLLAERKKAGDPAPEPPAITQEATTTAAGPADKELARAFVPTMHHWKVTKILKELGRLPETRAWPAVKAKAEASGKRVTRNQVRKALDDLGWKFPRGKPPA